LRLQTALANEFEMTDLGIIQNYLGAEFEYHPLGIFVHQRSYIKRILEKFGLGKCNPYRLPMHPRTVLTKSMGIAKVNSQLYRSIVGSLIYVCNTRPDICFSVSTVSRFMENPKQAHFNAAKQILRYLSGMLNYGLQFSSNENQELHTYSDADWGRDLDTMRSISGILHKVGDSCIFWTTKLQPVVSLSIAESEYIVLSEAAKDISYLRRLLNELGLSSHGSTQLLSDNQACIKLVSNPIMY
jgi:hypothetical protein